MTPRDDQILHETKHWIQSFVIALNLCPFAKKPYEAEQIRYVVSTAKDVEKMLQEYVRTIDILDSCSGKEVSNAFLILPFASHHFRDFIDLVSIAEQLLVEQNKENNYQLVAFHPKFQFAGTADNEPGNLVNRSPYPMIHILREKDVSDAIQAYGDTHQISLRNQKLLSQNNFRN